MDDVALAIVTYDSTEAQSRLNEAMNLISWWMEKHGFQLAMSKTEIVLLTRRRVPTEIDIRFDDNGNPHTIFTRPHVRYLGVLLDTKLTFSA